MASTEVLFSLTGDVRWNSRALKQLRVLRALSLRVTVLTLGSGPADALLIPGVRVHYLPRPPGRGPRFFGSVHRLFGRAAAGYTARVFHASDLYCLGAMRLAARNVGGHLIYDARELYAHVASTVKRPWVRSFWRFVEGRHIKAASHVFTVSDSIAGYLMESYGIDCPTVLHNVPEMQTAVNPAGTLRHRAGVDSGATVILHLGSIQKGRGCFLLLDAMRNVDGAVLVFMGGGPLKAPAMQAAQSYGLTSRVRFVEPVPPDQLLSVTADADLGVTLLENTCLNHRYALPNKLFEYLMAGVPVVASDLKEMRHVINRFNVGMLVNPRDRPELVQVLQDCVHRDFLRSSMRFNTPSVFETYSWSIASKRLKAAYSSLF